MMKGNICPAIRLAFRLVTCLLVTFMPGIAWGQNLDSLERLLNGPTLTDEERITILDDLNWFYHSIDAQRSIYFGKQGLALAQKNGDAKMKATFLKNIGIAYYMDGMHDTAMAYFKKASPIAEKLGEYRILVSIYNSFGNIYKMQSRYDQAIESYLKAAKVLEARRDLDGLALLYSNIGAIYQNMTNHGQALHYLKKAEKLAVETGDDKVLAGIYVSLSDISLYQDEPKAISVDYAEKALDIFHHRGDQFSENIALQTLAKVHYYHEDYHTAEQLAQKALQQAKDLGFPKPIAEAYMILSNIHLYQGRHIQTVETATEALATDSTDINITKNVYANLTKAMAYLGKPDRAKQYFDRYAQALDRYTNESFQNSLSAMEVQYETEKKEIRIIALEKQRELHVWLGIAGAIILLIALAFALIRYRLAVSRRKLAEEESQRLEQEKQLVAVQATLDGEAAERTRLAKDLHDGLGGMLSAVRLNLPQVNSDALLEGVDVSRFQTALDMLDASIQELRRVAHHMMPESLLRYGLKVSLADFCAAISTADFHYYGNEARLPGKMEIMIYRCIHELVNNALKHAEAKHINVQLVQEPDRISFTVQDDGKGFDQHTVSDGIGLRNIRQRVNAFQGKMDIFSSGEGTEVHVEMDVPKNEQYD